MSVHIRGMQVPEAAKVDINISMSAQANITAFVARHLSGRTSANGSILREIVGDPGVWGKNPRLHDRASAASNTATVSSKE